MKKIYQLALSISTFFTLLLHASFAYADLCPDNFAKLCDLKANKASDAVGGIVSILLIIAIILTLLYLIYGGIKWITSGGDKGKVDAARSHITAAIVGLVLALAAFLILNIILYFFTGKNLDESFTIPTLLD